MDVIAMLKQQIKDEQVKRHVEVHALKEEIKRLEREIRQFTQQEAR